MANIQDKIYDKYSINISEENILKLYKIDNPEASKQEIEDAITATRKRWNQSINGANEKNAERDRKRLSQADKYEIILRDKKLRKELFRFYNASTGNSTAKDVNSDFGVGFAREYFKIISSTKRLKKRDVNFFFEYFQEEKKNKKAILEMLSKDFKVHGLGKDADSVTEENVEVEGVKKKEDSPLIVNLFQEATIIRLKKCFTYHETLKNSRDVLLKYPLLSNGLYDFLELSKIGNVSDLSKKLELLTREVFSIKQEKGEEYNPLLDILNNLNSIVAYRDVVDNFDEFKLLIKYPKLSPYMYAINDMKPAAFKAIYGIAKANYSFRDEVDFLLTYFIPIHDNFGVSDNGIHSIIKNAEKKAKANKFLNKVDEKLGFKKKRIMPIWAEAIHVLVYIPIFIVYFVFELFKAIFTGLDIAAILLFVVMIIGENLLFPEILGIDTLLGLGKIFSKIEWYACLEVLTGEPIGNAYEAIIMSLAYIVMLLAIYTIPALFVGGVALFFSWDLNSRFDWIGYERMFQKIIQDIHLKSEMLWMKNLRGFYRTQVKAIIINILSILMLMGIIFVLPIGFKAFSEATGYFQEDVQPGTGIDNEVHSYGKAEIIVDSTSIRMGAGIDSPTVLAVVKGETYELTGNTHVDINQSTWYEVYINADNTETGWLNGITLNIVE